MTTLVATATANRLTKRMLGGGNPVAALLGQRDILVERFAAFKLTTIRKCKAEQTNNPYLRNELCAACGDAITPQLARTLRLMSCIDHALTVKHGYVFPVTEAPAPTQQQPTRKTSQHAGARHFASQYDGTCIRCRGEYKTKDDIFWIKGVGAWHVACDDKDIAPKPVPQATDNSLDGTYTVVHPSGSYLTIQIKTHTDGNYAGKTFLSYLDGPDNETNFSGIGFINGNKVAVWRSTRERLRQDTIDKYIEAFAVVAGEGDRGRFREAYALRSGRCARCHRKLSVPASIHQGVGPECASKGLM